MSTAKQQLKKVVRELSEDESRILLRSAGWLADQGEKLGDRDLAILSRGERQVRDGDFVWCRDVKRTDAQIARS